jgi:putative ABC transport system permease protein
LTWLARVREALRGIFFRARADAELEDELRFHLDMETQRLMREQRLPLSEARRRAAIVFGGVERHKEEVRTARGLAWLSGLSLDLRLGGRMLVRHWGLTVVGGLGMAVAIALGAVFHAVTQVVHAPLPLPDGSRIVALENWDVAVSNQERRLLFDFDIWKRELRSIRELAAYRTVGRNLIDQDGTTQPVPMAEMTASGFRVARVPVLLGRTLIDADEVAGATPVVVIGYDEWRTRFGADPAIIGREVRLGRALHTVVGVMPEGFAFPLNHRLWVPLQMDAAGYSAREGPGIRVFGRVAPGSSMEAARAELTALGERMARAQPATHERLRPRLTPWSEHIFDDMQGWEIPVVHGLLALLLLVVCANIAVLIYARTVTRTGEIAVRSALGASRRRIISQLFIEALVLASAAALAGLIAAGLALDHLNALLRRWDGPSGAGGLPFWIEFRLDWPTFVYAFALAAASAVIVGVVPALKVAGGGVQPALRQLTGGTGLQLGRTWSVLIVAQVAVTVACLPMAASAGWKLLLHATAEPGFAADEYLGGWLVFDADAAEVPDDAAPGRRLAALQSLLAQRLEVEPGVAAFTFVGDLPGLEPTVRVELERGADPAGAVAGGAAAGAARPGRAGDAAPAGQPANAGQPARFARVDAGFLDAFDVAVLSGRGLHAADAHEAATAVIVSRSFAQQYIGPGNAVGQRIRYVAGYRSGGVARTPAGVEMGRWYEIVGVVPDFPNAIDPDEVTARVYHALAPGQSASVALVVRSAANRPDLLSVRLRQIAAAVDPDLQLRELRGLDAVLREAQGGMRMAGVTVGLLMVSALLLSAAGIYALMSFTVVRRRREIGIRAALGAEPRRLLGSIFARALAQLSTGVAVGLLAAMLIELSTGGAVMGGRGVVLLPLVAALMMAVGLLAALGPARKGLRIHPTEALRAE